MVIIQYYEAGIFMELVYVWCNEYGGLGEVSLNLSTEFDFDVKFPKLGIRWNPS